MPFRIMIVDDSATNRLRLAALVARVAETVSVTHASPTLALEDAAAQPPDVLFVDYLMPEMDGVAFLRAFRQLPRCQTVPAVMITALEQRSALYEALEAGASDFLTKPADEVELLARLRNMLKLRAIERELYELAHFDALTGLANRRHFLACLDEAVERAREERTPLSLAVFDVDHFKRINDGFGHPAGDRVLHGLGTACGGLLRQTDLVGRLGGEEFAALLPAAGLTQAVQLSEALRQGIAGLALQDEEGRPIPVTISLGVATLGLAESGESLLRRADQALYAAKRGGRNQVRMSPGPLPSALANPMAETG